MKGSIVSACLMLAMATGWCLADEHQTKGKPKPVKKVLMVIASKNFRDEEYAVPRKALEARGIKVTVGCKILKQCIGMLGQKVSPNILLSKVHVEEFDGVIFVGGSGSKEYWDDKIAHEIASDAVSSGKVLGAICIAPVTLARAGLLRDKKATVFPSVARHLKKGGAIVLAEDVVTDGKIVTGGGPETAAEFAKAFIQILYEKGTK